MPGIKKKSLLEILFHLLFWAAIFYVEISFTSLSERFKQNINGVVSEIILVRSTFPLSFLTLSLLMLLFYTNIFWLFKRILQYKNRFGAIVFALAWTTLIFLVNYFSVRLLLPFTKITSYEWRHLQLGVLFIFLFTLGLSLAYFLSKEWNRNELLRKQMEAHQLRTELKFLKSQVNPHFLFNTLNNLYSMAQAKGNDELADVISKLSEMMRYMIYESNTERVLLKNELLYLQNYITLNKLRYADQEATVIFDFPEQLEDLLIAPMIFIPFVENAFKHGVLINQSSQIDISVWVLDQQVVFSCENKNYSFIKKMDDRKSGIGLENVKRRLELVYADHYELTIKNDLDKYAVLLKINPGC